MAVHKLHPAFLNCLKFTLQVPFPSAKDRAELWRRALPPKCPTTVTKANLADLGTRFKLSGGAINKAAYRAAAAVALRPVRAAGAAAAGSAASGSSSHSVRGGKASSSLSSQDRVVSLADLEKAAEVEATKCEGEASRLFQQQYL